MIPITRVVPAFSVLLLVGLLAGAPKGDPRFSGVWKLDRKKSADIDPWRQLTLEIRQAGASVILIRTWKAGRYSQRDAIMVKTGGVTNRVPLRPGKWMEAVHLGVYVSPNTERQIVAKWQEGGKVLWLESRYTVETSQGEREIQIDRTLRLSKDGKTLTLTEKRSTRQSGPPLVFVFTKEEE
jgi:hypothetical protein